MVRIVPDLLEERAAVHGDRPALRFKSDGTWRTITWRGYRDGARRFARALVATGVEPGKGVAVMSYNRPEWFLADQGAIAAGAYPVGIYTNLTAEQAAYVLRHSETRVAVVENREYLDKILASRHELPELATLVLLDGDPAGEGVVGWDSFLARGDAVPEAALDERLAVQQPDDTCTLIYTSGTTGPPKGVMQTHRNLVWNATTVVGEFTVGPDYDVISYLPLAHSAEQIISLYFPLASGSARTYARCAPTSSSACPGCGRRCRRPSSRPAPSTHRSSGRSPRGRAASASRAATPRSRAGRGPASTRWPGGWSSTRCGRGWGSTGRRSVPPVRRPWPTTRRSSSSRWGSPSWSPTG
jgi:long-subunit acyl-CoA synthetase (AMP-forming)